MRMLDQALDSAPRTNASNMSEEDEEGSFVNPFRVDLVDRQSLTVPSHLHSISRSHLVPGFEFSRTAPPWPPSMQHSVSRSHG
jgi:hypothetical protein